MYLYVFLFKMNYLSIIIVSRKIDLSIRQFTLICCLHGYIYTVYPTLLRSSVMRVIFFSEVGCSIKKIYVLFPKI